MINFQDFLQKEPLDDHDHSVDPLACDSEIFVFPQNPMQMNPSREEVGRWVDKLMHLASGNEKPKNASLSGSEIDKLARVLVDKRIV